MEERLRLEFQFFAEEHKRKIKSGGDLTTMIKTFFSEQEKDLNALQKTIYNLKRKKPGYQATSKRSKPVNEEDESEEESEEYDEESYYSEEKAKKNKRTKRGKKARKPKKISESEDEYESEVETSRKKKSTKRKQQTRKSDISDDDESSYSDEVRDFQVDSYGVTSPHNRSISDI